MYNKTIFKINIEIFKIALPKINSIGRDIII